MTRLLLFAVLAAGLFAQSMEGTRQETGTKLEFEVASVKPTGQPGGLGLNVTAAELRAPGITLAGLITFTFELHPKQVSGLPSWAETEGFEIIAKLPQGGD